MDIRVGCSVIFGLSDTFEGFLQEGGRSMRGGEVETQGKTGFSFFLHKGALGKERVWKNESMKFFVLQKASTVPQVLNAENCCQSHPNVKQEPSFSNLTGTLVMSLISKVASVVLTVSKLIVRVVARSARSFLIDSFLRFPV